jgi:hypothetical protein
MLLPPQRGFPKRVDQRGKTGKPIIDDIAVRLPNVIE